MLLKNHHYITKHYVDCLVSSVYEDIFAMRFRIIIYLWVKLRIS